MPSPPKMNHTGPWLGNFWRLTAGPSPQKGRAVAVYGDEPLCLKRVRIGRALVGLVCLMTGLTGLSRPERALRGEGSAQTDAAKPSSGAQSEKGTQPAGPPAQQQPKPPSPQAPTPAPPVEPGKAPLPLPLPSQQPPTATVAPPTAEMPSTGVSFRLENADLLQFINLVASQLKLNYVVDPAVKGTVTITTAGGLRPEDLFPILQSVLRINGASAVQVGNLYRIVPLAQTAKIPVEVFGGSDEKAIPKDDRLMIQIVPLRFVLATDMAKLLSPFLSDGGTVAVHEAGNVLILEDSSLNVKRLMDIIEQFDGPTFAQQRMRLVTVQNNVASGLIPELESIFAAYAMSEKHTPLRFIALDRINSILVVTADPSALEEVEKWIEKLDQPVPPTGIQTFIYHVQNSEADYLARLLTGVQERRTPANPPGGAGSTGGGPSTGGLSTGGPSTGVAGGAGAATETTGEAGAAGSELESGRSTREGVQIITDPVNNSLILRCTPQQYTEIVKTLKELDVVPREVLIEARVYEVTLTGDLTFGVSYYLQQRSSASKQFLASFAASAANPLQASVGGVIGQTRELLAFLNASENRSRVRVLSAPSVLATDNSDAKIQVGSEIPILTSQGVIPGVQAGANSVFTNTIQNRDTGIILSVTPRITSTGLVSLRIVQEISQPQAATAGSIQSPSFLKRSIATRAVIGDAETIALGGLISDNVTTSRNRVPLLGDIPGLGLLFGSTTYSRQKTELIVLLTPHIVKSVSEGRDATRELRDGLRDLKRSFKKDNVLNR
jgi:general secretion pathway protein D